MGIKRASKRVSIATNEMRIETVGVCIVLLAFGLESVCRQYLRNFASNVIPFMIVTLSNNREVLLMRLRITAIKFLLAWNCDSTIAIRVSLHCQLSNMLSVVLQQHS